MKTNTTLFFATLIACLFLLPVLVAAPDKQEKQVDEIDLLIQKSSERHKKAVKLNQAIDDVVVEKVQKMKAEVKELKAEVIVANKKLEETKAIVISYEQKIHNDNAAVNQPFSIFAIEQVPDTTNRK